MFVRKFAKKIAVILILLMLANTVTGCTIINGLTRLVEGSAYPDWWLPITGLLFGETYLEVTWWIMGGLIDIALIVAMGFYAIEKAKENNGVSFLDEDPYEANYRTYMTAADNPLTDYYFLFDRINSFPEAACLTQTVQFLNGTTEINTSLEKLTSLPETKLVSLLTTINSLPKEKINSSINRINSMTKEELVSLLEAFNLLPEDDLNLIADEFNFQFGTGSLAARFN